jgi:hypothetical protein
MDVLSSKLVPTIGRRAVAAVLVAGAVTLAVACGSDGRGAGGTASGTSYGGPSSGPAHGNDPVPRQRYGGEYANGVATGDTEEGAAFARWVLDQDPRREYLTDAVVRDDSNLGVKVQPTISRGELHQLMESLATGMARQFPDRPIQVSAFYQSGDKLADAYYDPSRGRVDVQMERG